HQDRRWADLGRWDADENTSIHRAAKPLPVRREVRASGQGQRQGEGGRAGGLRAAELYGADSAGGELGGVEQASSGAVREATRAAVARVGRDHWGTLRARSHCTVAAAGGGV